jgi:hypothetical protein
MNYIYHSNICTTVDRDKDNIIARSSLVSSKVEMVGLITATTDFIVKTADWEIYRSPASKLNGGDQATPLIGAEAYLGAAAALKAVGQAAGRLPQAILAECVKGIIQAETYLFTERGFASAKEYEDSWQDSYAGSCRLYTNAHRKTVKWHEHVADRKWGNRLFTRFKTAALCQAAAGVIVNGAFSDSFHELGISFNMKEGIILDCTGGFVRAPDPICCENRDHLGVLNGLAVEQLTKRELGKYCGGSEGCSHLVDLLGHMITTIKQVDTL